jgi:hypothetical protein
MRGRAIGATIIVIAGGAFALFHEAAPGDPAPVQNPISIIAGTPVPPRLTEARERVSSVGDDEGDRAAADLARHVVASLSGAITAERSQRDQAALEAELATIAEQDVNPVELRVRLERLLLGRPDLAPAAARALVRFSGRERAFAVARSLLVAAKDPEVSASLIAATLSDRPEGQREAAVTALAQVPGPAALGAAQTAFEDANAPPSVRAAGAFALSMRLGEVDDPAPLVAAARRIAFAPAEAPRLRAEALHLIASTTAAPGDDLALARAALADASTDEVALAAARLALARGGDRAAVSQILAARGTPAAARAGEILARGGRP